jgi:hypothetical protein
MWSVILVISVLAIYILYETAGPTLVEGFRVPIRSDMQEASAEGRGYSRDPRYAAQFADVQGTGVAGDFCRAVSKKGDPDSLRIACALALREGMDTLEFHSKSKKEGFRFSRDDYWRHGPKQMDYCRILRNEVTGAWASFCAVTTKSGIGPKEEQDATPPPYIAQLLTAYEGILAWYRFQEDGLDTTGATELSLVGRAQLPTMIKPVKTRGLQLNRYPAAAKVAGEKAPPLHDLLRFGEKGTLHLDQDVKPSTIRAISFWIFWDQFEKDASVLYCSTADGKNRVWIGVDGSGPSPSPMKDVQIGPAQEITPQQLQNLGDPRVEEVPLYAMKHQKDPHGIKHELDTEKTASWIFEIWDESQRIMRIKAPFGAKIGQWQHVTVTTTDSTTWWPTWQIWLDGVMVTEQPEGRMIPALFLTNNRIGENVRGCLQDFRIYREPMPAAKIKEAMDWSSRLLHPTP